MFCFSWTNKISYRVLASGVLDGRERAEEDIRLTVLRGAEKPGRTHRSLNRAPKHLEEGTPSITAIHLKPETAHDVYRRTKEAFNHATNQH